MYYKLVTYTLIITISLISCYSKLPEEPVCYEELVELNLFANGEVELCCEIHSDCFKYFNRLVPGAADFTFSSDTPRTFCDPSTLTCKLECSNERCMCDTNQDCPTGKTCTFSNQENECTQAGVNQFLLYPDLESLDSELRKIYEDVGWCKICK